MKSTSVLLTLILSIPFLSFIERQTKSTGIEDYADESHKYSGIPPAGKTGAPGEGICYDCHSQGTLNGGGGNISIDFNNGVNTYQLDSTYIVTIKVKETNSTAFGFESTILDNNLTRAGSYTILDSLKTAFQALSGREYLSHNNVFANLSLDSLEWQFKWTAPSTNVGPLTIYSASVANPFLISIAAGNVYVDSLKIYPDSLTSVNELSSFSDIINIYPNPIQNESTTISYTLQGEDYITISVFGLNGKLVKSFNEGLKRKGLHQFILSTKGFREGIYFLKLMSDKETKTRKIIITK
jgi:Secretion system C-terminal sorting domain